MAPDFEYFLVFKAHHEVGHTFPGILVFTLPLALLTLWIFHAYVKVPAAALLPPRIQSKVAGYLGEFRFGGLSRFALIVWSILVGIATHLLWDSLTHTGTYPYEHWELLRRWVLVPVLGPVPYYKLFQHGSTVLGLVIVSVWLFRWYREREPRRVKVRPILSRASRYATLAAGIGVALGGGFIRALWGIGLPSDQFAFRRFTAEVVVTCMALAWWQLVGYGLVSSKRLRRFVEP